MGAKVQIIENAEGSKANLFVTIGPGDRGGVMLSGHTDVVPVVVQIWTVPAFAMTSKDGKVYGRGSANIKEFVAAMLSAARKASGQKSAHAVASGAVLWSGNWLHRCPLDD